MKQVTARLFRTIIFAVLAMVAVILAIVVYRSTQVTYTYETAITASMTDYIEAQGFAVFNEIPVEGSGEWGYLVEDGDRVSAGMQIAEKYTSDDQAAKRAEVKQLETQISLLEKSQNTSTAQIDVLLQQRNSSVFSLLEKMEDRSFDGLDSLKADYLLEQNKLLITTGAESDYSDLIAEYQSQINADNAALSGLSGIYAPCSGYFVCADNMKLLSAAPEDILAMDAESMQESLSGDCYDDDSGYVGKIVTDYSWQFTGVCTPEQAERLEAVSSVQICFPGKADTPLTAKVTYVEKNASADMLRFTLECDYINADVLSLGADTVRIIFNEFTGLKVNKDALHVMLESQLEDDSSSSAASDSTTGAESDGEAEQESTEIAADTPHGDTITGVYVKYGKSAKFLKIVIEFESPTENYVLVAPGKVGTENELRLYDEIIVSGKDLYDGKLL